LFGTIENFIPTGCHAEVLEAGGLASPSDIANYARGLWPLRSSFECLRMTPIV